MLHDPTFAKGISVYGGRAGMVTARQLGAFTPTQISPLNVDHLV